MNLIFLTKKQLFFAAFLFCMLSFGQKEFQKLGNVSLGLSYPIPTGNNFLNNGMSGKVGLNLKAQFFVYKNVFVAGTLGNNYFKVTDKTIVGSYNKTKESHQFISIGYQLVSSYKTRLGLSVSLYGESKYENHNITNNMDAYQNDSGKINNYEIYFDYMINDEFALYLNYAYRNDKMNIKAPSEIQNVFNNANFHSIGIGVKFYFGNKDIVSGK